MFDKDDRFFLLSSILVPLFLWWLFVGREKYSMKGQK